MSDLDDARWMQAALDLARRGGEAGEVPVGAVVLKDGQLLGYNTDGPGFLSALREELSFKAAGKAEASTGA